MEDDVEGLALAGSAGGDVTRVSREVLERLAPTESPRGPISVIEIPAPRRVSRDFVALHVSDPGNAGTLIRTSAAFGFDVAVGPIAVDVWSPKVLRSAAGAHFNTAIGSVPPGAGLIAAVPAGAVPLDQMHSRLDRSKQWGVMVGSEAHGLGPQAIAAADVSVSIPMPGGMESLNAAVAGSIVAYELMRWRNSVRAPGLES
jgi:TrmH family RNA methyltransferase